MFQEIIRILLHEKDNQIKHFFLSYHSPKKQQFLNFVLIFSKHLS